MDYRAILKFLRKDQNIMVTQLLKSTGDIGLYSSSYSRVESLNQHLDLPQFFEVCRVLNVDPRKLWAAAKNASLITDINFNDLNLQREDLLSLKITDDAMVGGPVFSICPGAKVWYKKTQKDDTKAGDLVVISDSENNLHVRLLINDLGIYKLKAWQTTDFKTLVLQTPYKIIGTVKDVTYKAD
jgi:hypothetical protein